ncbi:MAG: threonine--tRNA ligase [bacterium]|nr:threonine--tRNA ligase [bacterium]
MLTLTFPDGACRQVQPGATPLEVAKEISPSLAKAALAAELDGEILSLVHPLQKDARVRFLTWEDEAGKAVFWHSSAHVLAQAVKELWPEAMLDDGPPTEAGFYYDIKFPQPIGEEDLPRIEEKMREILTRKERLVRRELPASEARRFFQERGERFKLDLIDAIEARGEAVSVYEQGAWADLCRGPHLLDTARIKAVKVLSVAGAYLRGDEQNEQLQRVRAISFLSQAELDQYLFMIEEAKKRDHRKLGRELELFSFHEVGPGFPFWHPNGAIVWDELVGFWRELHRAAGYQEIRTPIILSEELWHRSGHWDNYGENMYFTKIDEGAFAVKPMNCPGHLTVFGSQPHSYKELPLKYAELGQVHRHEKSGVLHGLFRVRSFVQDDAHVFCTPEQAEEEVVKIISLVDRIYATFGFKYEMELSTRPESKYIGSLEVWAHAEAALAAALRRVGASFKLNPGDGAFYGPKIDFHIKDSLGRRWQCATIQLDFSMPERFGLEYIGVDGERHRPVMIHRAIFGSLERFIGILIEHFAGNLPTWLAPVQAIVLPITEGQLEAARAVQERLAAAGIRAQLETRNEKIGYKIRAAETRKIPWMLVVGAREAEQGLVAVRRHGRGDLGVRPVEEMVMELRRLVDGRSLEEELPATGA